MAKAKAQYILEAQGVGNAESVIRRMAQEQKKHTDATRRTGAEYDKAQKSVQSLGDKVRAVSNIVGSLPVKIGVAAAAFYAIKNAVSFIGDELKAGATARTIQRMVDDLPQGAQKVAAALQGLQNTMDTTTVQGFVLKMDRAGYDAEKIKAAMGFAMSYAQQAGIDTKAAVTQVTQALMSAANGSAEPFRAFGIVATDTSDAFSKMQKEAADYMRQSAGDVGIKMAQMETAAANIRSDAEAAAAALLELSDEDRRAEQERLDLEQRRVETIRVRSELVAKERKISIEAAKSLVTAEMEVKQLGDDRYRQLQQAKSFGEDLNALERIWHHKKLYNLGIESKATREKLELQQGLLNSMRILLDNQDDVERFWKSFGDAGNSVIDQLIGRLDQFIPLPHLLGDPSSNLLDGATTPQDPGARFAQMVAEDDAKEAARRRRRRGGGRRKKQLSLPELALQLGFELPPEFVAQKQDTRLSKAQELYDKFVTWTKTTDIPTALADIAAEQARLTQQRVWLEGALAEASSDADISALEARLVELSDLSNDADAREAVIRSAGSRFAGIRKELLAAKVEEATPKFLDALSRHRSTTLWASRAGTVEARVVDFMSQQLIPTEVAEKLRPLAEKEMFARFLEETLPKLPDTVSWLAPLARPSVDSFSAVGKMAEMIGEGLGPRSGESFLIHSLTSKLGLQLLAEVERANFLSDLAAGADTAADSFHRLGSEIQMAMSGTVDGQMHQGAAALLDAMGSLSSGVSDYITATSQKDAWLSSTGDVINAGKTLTAAFVDDYETRAALMAVWETAEGVRTIFTSPWESATHFAAAALYTSMAAGAWKTGGNASGATAQGSSTVTDLTRRTTSGDNAGDTYIVVGGDLVAGDEAAGSWTARMLDAHARNGGRLNPKLVRF